MIRYRNHGGDHFVLMALQGQVRGHERAKRAESVKEHIGEKGMARDDARRCPVIHRVDGSSIFDGIELALRFHRVLDALVFIYSDSLDPRHLVPRFNWKSLPEIIVHRRASRYLVPQLSRQPSVMAFFLGLWR
jgi:hypothetical protein